MTFQQNYLTSDSEICHHMEDLRRNSNSLGSLEKKMTSKNKYTINVHAVCSELARKTSAQSDKTQVPINVERSTTDVLEKL